MRGHSRRGWAPALALLAVLLGVGPARAATVGTSILDDYSRACAAVANAIKPSVFFIEVRERTQVRSTRNDDGRPGITRAAADPQGGDRTPTERAEASGVVITASGDILTNQHVVEDATRITVSTLAGQSYQATVIATDKIRDLAVIRISPTQPLQPAVLGNADDYPAGSWVMAVGFPFGAELDPSLRYDPSVTVGVVSALHRDVETDTAEPSLTDLTQTDAAINPGNSGGPLVNSRAEVVGVNEGIFTTSDTSGNVGVGFAIPIDPRTREIIRTLQAGRSVVRGQLGVSVLALTPERKQRTGASHGAFVQSVGANTPAARAEIQAGDVIIRYGDREVRSTDDLIGLIYTTPPGSTVSLEVVRNHQRVTLNATIAQLTPS